MLLSIYQRPTGISPHEDAGRDWSAAATSEGMLETAGNHGKPGEAGRTPPRSLPREHGPAHTSISGFWPPEPGENTLLFEATQVVVPCDPSLRKTDTGN